MNPLVVMLMAVVAGFAVVFVRAEYLLGAAKLRADRELRDYEEQIHELLERRVHEWQEVQNERPRRLDKAMRELDELRESVSRAESQEDRGEEYERLHVRLHRQYELVERLNHKDPPPSEPKAWEVREELGPPPSKTLRLPRAAVDAFVASNATMLASIVAITFVVEYVL